MAEILGMDGNKKGNNQQPQAPKVGLDKSKPMVCENCGDDLFVPAVKFRKISKLLTGQPKDAIIPIEVYCCGNCGEVNQELYPEELKNLDKK